MDLSVPPVAVEFADAARRAFERLGGVELARRAEANPALREEAAGSALRDLGALELPAREEAEAAAAAAELCRVAGTVALPYPVASLLAGQGTPLALVDSSAARIDHGDLGGRWTAVDLDGATWEAEPAGPRRGSKLGPFVVDVRLSPVARDPDPGGVALALTLGACTILGAAERAQQLAAEHVKSRVQFGRPLGELQAVRFAVADMLVAIAGLRELSRYTAWRVSTASEAAMPDAWALRVAAIECARLAFRTSHQLHGAIGFCDEHDLSILSRHTQPLLRLPAHLERSTAFLEESIRGHGFEGLFLIPAGAIG